MLLNDPKNLLEDKSFCQSDIMGTHSFWMWLPGWEHLMFSRRFWDSNTWTFQFGWQMVPLHGVNSPSLRVQLAPHPDWKVLVMCWYLTSTSGSDIFSLITKTVIFENARQDSSWFAPSSDTYAIPSIMVQWKMTHACEGNKSLGILISDFHDPWEELLRYNKTQFHLKHGDSLLGKDKPLLSP